MRLITVIVFLCIIVFSTLSFGENIDLIVMVDISASMDEYFDEVISYFINDLLSNNINSGDNFYFLIFSSRTEPYGMFKIDNEPESVEGVINKIKLVQPIALYTDLVEALQSLYDFSSSLPQERPKLILLLTDGIHDPPQASRYNLESSEIVTLIERIGQSMRKNNWVFKIIKFPLSPAEIANSNNSESSIKKDYLDILADNSESEIIEYNLKEDNLTEIESEIPKLRNNNLTNDHTTSDNLSNETGDNVTIYLIDLSKNPFLYVIIAVLAIALIILLLIYRKKSSGKIDKAIRKTASKKKVEGKSQQIEMRVKMQNPKIGYRNIHQIGRDNYKTIGGGKSAFLIYFIKFPSHIAEVQWNGKDFTFVPVKTEFFPELKGPIKKCLNKDIPALSKKGHSIIINFYEYISPLDQINSIFNKVIHSYS